MAVRKIEPRETRTCSLPMNGRISAASRDTEPSKEVTVTIAGTGLTRAA
jgi:hypothetical protein